MFQSLTEQPVTFYALTGPMSQFSCVFNVSYSLTVSAAGARRMWIVLPHWTARPC